MKKDKLNKFSVSLGLLDYGNPIVYSITIITIIKYSYHLMKSPFNAILLVGAIISILVGFIIPTGKVMVGLGIIKFRMPVSLVFCVNTGIFLSGLMLLKYVINMNLYAITLIFISTLLILYILYKKSNKFNTIAVLIGAIGYIMLYSSLIILSIRKEIIIPIILYIIAILLFIMLCTIGIKANLKNPKVHWIIEISNILCQLFVAIATIILFS